MERRVFRYGSQRYVYGVEFSNRKTFSIVVSPSSEITLKVPQDTTTETIEEFLKKKWSWLRKQLGELALYKKPRHEKEYISGESFHYLGRQYMLRVEEGKEETVKVSPGILTLFSTKSPRNSEHNKYIFEKWYLDRCAQVFKKEYIALVQKYGIKKMPRLKIREMSRRWGSYQKAGIINLNPKLLQASKTDIRYVITHELCHIDYPMHDEKFFALLGSRMPDWKKVKEELEVRFG
jgi:predicted metal-dependent hydrolase